MSEVYIYVLKDPDTDKVFYVGKTICISTRISCHISQAKTQKDNKKSQKIKEILEKNKLPSIHVIEKCSPDNWQDREQFWIKKYRQDYPDLTNISDGNKNRLDITSDLRFSLRIPEQLLFQLELLAKQEERSLNSEILVILRKYVEAKKETGENK